MANSSMTSAFYVKVYYTKQNQQQPEIRRFAIDISPENNVYQELCTKIATYQPDIQLTGFTLQYIDEENERITFSSNEELRSAISTSKDLSAFKIFVTPNRSQTTTIPTSSSANRDRECHTGISCDGCDSAVVGNRYKCVVCPNYDLCENCSSTGLHSEHNMIKISKPSNLYHPYGSRHHSRRHHPFLPPSPFVPNPEFLQQIQAQIPQWLPNRENTAHIRQHVQQHIDSIKTNTQTQIGNSRQYLENVGQYLQNALSPLGIDCDYRVDGQAASSNENPEASTTPKTAEGTNNGGLSSWLNMLRTTPTTTEQSQPAEKAVEECVEKMKAMGFAEVNENLMELIRSKKGDLNSVLDEINKKE